MYYRVCEKGESVGYSRQKSDMPNPIAEYV